MKFLAALAPTALFPALTNAQYLILQFWNEYPCVDASLYYFEQFDTGTFLTNFAQPGFAFKVIQNTGDCDLHMYSESNEGGTSGFIYGADMDVGECTEFTAGYPIASILTTCS